MKKCKDCKDYRNYLHTDRDGKMHEGVCIWGAIISARDREGHTCNEFSKKKKVVKYAACGGGG